MWYYNSNFVFLFRDGAQINCVNLVRIHREDVSWFLYYLTINSFQTGNRMWMIVPLFKVDSISHSPCNLLHLSFIVCNPNPAVKILWDEDVSNPWPSSSTITSMSLGVQLTVRYMFWACACLIILDMISCKILYISKIFSDGIDKSFISSAIYGCRAGDFKALSF